MIGSTQFCNRPDEKEGALRHASMLDVRMRWIENASLQSLNTFGVAARARVLAAIDQPEDIRTLNRLAPPGEGPRWVLGGGSNVLFLEDFPGLILFNQIKHLRFYSLDGEGAVSVGGGVSWHALVMETLARGWGGLENLALIPGTCGAAPIQNIGAYGLEQSDLFLGCQAVHLESGAYRWFEPEECHFGYRQSVFKGALKGMYLITDVHYRLYRHRKPVCSYAVLQEALQTRGITDPTPRQVAVAVIRIRRSKLPEPDRVGNAGSFFKNPLVDVAQAEALRAQYPQLRTFPVSDHQVKIPAAWLIDQCGWKGYREGPVGCNPRQPLVLVHYGGGTGADIASLAQRIAWSVYERFGIVLEPEVQFIGASVPATMYPDWPARPSA